MTKAKGKAQPLTVGAPDWALWLHVDSAKLWELAQLSLGREPNFLDGAGSEDPRHSRLATLRRHMAAGSTILRRPDGYAWFGEPDSIHQSVTVSSFRQWARVVGWSLPPELDSAGQAPAIDLRQGGPALHDATKSLPGTPAAPLKPVPRGLAHEAAILDALRAAGYDPRQLPRTPAGKASPAKEAARGALPRMTPSVFNKAWQRLRADGEIADLRTRHLHPNWVKGEG